jgi:8-oxo-dGTP pyrophosphatase MutT (NUDIX family)
VAPSAFAAVRDLTGRLLLVRRWDTGDWELPGRHVDPGESASDAAVRETAEESGMTVEITGLSGGDQRRPVVHHRRHPRPADPPGHAAPDRPRAHPRRPPRPP